MPELPKPKNDIDQKLLDDVAEFGWHWVFIPEDEEGPNECFTIGLYHTYKHPEVLIIGLDQERSRQFLWIIADKIKLGKNFVARAEYEDIAESYPVSFVEVHKKHYPNHLGTCRWFYQGDNFPVLQLIFTDRDGRFPWQEGYSLRGLILED